MERRHWAARAAIVCLLVCLALGGARTQAQENSDRSFFSTLSYDAYFGSIYNRYHGSAIGGRVAVPLVSVPTLNGLFTRRAMGEDDLVLLPGLKAGSVDAGGDPLSVRVQYLAPDLSLHYSFLRFSGLTFAVGPSLEFIYTNNYRQYLGVPVTGFDLGVAFQPSPHFQIGLEQRWITGVHGPHIVNAAHFPSSSFSHIGLVMRFSLPWKTEGDTRENARIEYEQQQTASYVATEPGQPEAHSARLDTLESKVRVLESKVDTLESKLARLSARADATNAAVDRFNERIMVVEPQFVFTRDPFKGGNLVNDDYLKNVFLDILDEDYVWQLRAGKKRMRDAEKIREYFTLYNDTLGRRIVIVEDDNVPLFSLKCLGKALGVGKD